MCNECRANNWPEGLPHKGSEADVHRKKDFVGRTLDGFRSFLVTSIFSERYAKLNGLLQTVDPRIKIVSIFLLVITASFINRIEVLSILYLFTVVIAYLSGIEIGFFLKRVWLFIPLFTGVVVIPALFNLITPGTPLLYFIQPGGSIGPWILNDGLSITSQGTYSAILLVTRVAASVSLVVLMTLTTRWNDILYGLQILRIPKAFVMTLGMAYRYIYMLLRLAEEMALARRSRIIRPQSLKQNQKWIGARMAQLLKRSFETSEEVHLAMIARGFNGSAKTLSILKTDNSSYIWLILSIFLSVTLLWLI
jgi:cobalt/nickel transport system permease protein